MLSLTGGFTFVIYILALITIPGLVSPQLDEEKKPTFLTASIGESVVFNCPLDFPHDNPIPYILRWNKEGETIFSWYNGVLSASSNFLDRISLLTQRSHFGKGSINLTNIRETDGGWYECKVLFPNRTPNSRPNGTWFHLTVDGGNLLAVPPMNQTIMEGEPVQLTCVTKEEDVTVTWMKDGVALSELAELNERSKIESEGSLSISATNMADLGLFTCEVVNKKGEKQTASAFLNVQYKAKIVYSPREVYFPFGRPALLDCHFRANPPLTKLRWEKDGFLFDPFNVQGVFYRKNGSLYFSKVDEFHGGQYTCTPFNDLGTEGPSPPIRVVVQRPPVFTITPSNLYLRKTGESVEIPCEAFDGDGTHRPTIVWFKKDGTPLPPDRVIISGGNLTLSKIQESDRGFYQCVASNEAATITSETELIIENTSPRAPYNLTAESTMTSITLRWIPGFVRPNLNYSVWYRSLETPEWRTIRIKGRGTTETIIGNLNPGREYELMVLSEDQKGDGMFSKALKARTKGSPIERPELPQEFKSPIDSFQQISAPRNVQIELSKDGYLIEWLPPEFGEDAVKSYTVRWFKDGDDPVISETKHLFLTISEFDEDSIYFVQVTAHSTNNYEASSELVSFYIPAYEKARAITIGIAMSIGFVFAILLIGYYVRKRYVKSHFKSSH